MSSREQIANLLTDHSPRLGWDLTKNDCHPCTDTRRRRDLFFFREEICVLDSIRDAPRRGRGRFALTPPRASASLTRRMPSRCWRSSRRAPVGVSTWRTCLTPTASRRLPRRDVGEANHGRDVPHYLSFAAEEIPDGDTLFKCAPPIREAENRERLWEVRDRRSHWLDETNPAIGSPRLVSFSRPGCGKGRVPWDKVA